MDVNVVSLPLLHEQVGSTHTAYDVKRLLHQSHKFVTRTKGRLPVLAGFVRHDAASRTMAQRNGATTADDGTRMLTHA